MGFLKAVFLLCSLFLVIAIAECTLHINLQPSTFNDYVGDPELLLFEVVEPVPYNKGCGCPDQPFGPTALLPTPAECEIACGWPCERVCGGVFRQISASTTALFFLSKPRETTSYSCVMRKMDRRSAPSFLQR